MRCLLAAIVAITLPALAFAQGFVESVSPPVIERGKTTRVTFVGHGFGAGLDVWHSLSRGAIVAKLVESHPDRLVFDLIAASDAPVGVCGLRVATRDGLTNALLVMVDDLPVRGQIAAGPPVALPLPACVWGTFREATLDRYVITVAAGETVSFEAVANRLGKDADPLITIRDSAGRIVVERDNDPGLYFDFRFAHTFARAGAYTLEVRDARYRASEHHHYVLRVGKFPPERVATPPAIAASRLPGVFFEERKRPGDNGTSWVPVSALEAPLGLPRNWDDLRDSGLAQATAPPTQLAFLLSPMRANPFLPLDRLITAGRLQAAPVAVPGTLCGVLRRPNQPQAFAFRLEKGQHVYVRGEARTLNSPLDLDYVLVDRFGRELRRPNESRDAEPTLDFTAGAAGEYGLLVRDVLRDGSDSHVYKLTVRDKPFPPTLAAEVEGLTIPQGSYQPIPILISRTGSTGAIKLALEGASAGLHLTPNEIAEGSASTVCKLEAEANAPLGVHTIQIVAECNGDRVFVNTRPLIDKKLVNVDLIPIALREDQTRLPPSLTDRFAVQITPPAFFTFELPQASVTLCRYQSAPIPIVTTRAADFDGPISFHAVGGQLADKKEGRTRVYADFPPATAGDQKVAGVVVSKILSNLGKSRIDVSATATHEGRTLTLTHTFDLEIVTAFRFPSEPVKVSLLPGETAKVKLLIQRTNGYSGAMALQLSPMAGVEFPETVAVAKGESTVEFSVTAAADSQPRRQGLSVHATGEVAGFEEEVRGQPVEIEVKKIEPPKKK